MLQQDFFCRWTDANRQKDVYVMDITRVSSCSEQIDFVRWGIQPGWGKACIPVCHGQRHL